METWFANNWWWIWSIVGGSAYLVYRVHCRGGNESLLVRVFYALAPVLDAESEERRQLTPRAIALFAIDIVIILTAMIVVPGFRG